MAQSWAVLGALVIVLLLNAAMVVYFARSERAVDVAELGSAEESQPDDDRPGASAGDRPELLLADHPASGTVESETQADSAAPPLEHDGPAVDCHHCGAVNEQGYQYCRWCISVLGRDDSAAHSGASASGRTF